MSLRKRVEQIARETAIAAVKTYLDQRSTQIALNNSGAAKVSKVENGVITVVKADGSEQKVLPAGNRAVGTADYGVVSSGIFL